MDDFNLGGDARHTRVRMEQGSVFLSNCLSTEDKSRFSNVRVINIVIDVT